LKPIDAAKACSGASSPMWLSPVSGSLGGASGVGSPDGKGVTCVASCLVIRPPPGIRFVLLMAGGLSSGAVARLNTLGDGDEAVAFLSALARRGRSSYTSRTYALGLAHFLEWLTARAVRLAEVERGDVVDYVAEFARNEVGGEAVSRAAATVNHRVSVLASFFAWLIERDQLAGQGPWLGRVSPIPPGSASMAGGHGMPGRDAPRRGRRGELRRRVPHRMPARAEPAAVAALMRAARSARDRALLTLLWRCGQRIGDWSDEHGRHGVLGMRLGDLDRASSTIVVSLKGARDEHRVPVSADFWPHFAAYVREERGLGAPEDPAWVALRRGRGRPLGYATFETQLRELGRRAGARVTAHMFRHALAQALVDTAGLKVAQEVLGHAHVSTTARSYARLDEAAMVSALAAAGEILDRPQSPAADGAAAAEGGFVFAYDPDTLAELEQAVHGGIP
jgi:site-specific recombinase XerD